MANCLWNFEVNTTTGFEADVDVTSGVSIRSWGDGSGADAVPCPTVPGRTGNGRLLASINKYNEFTTSAVAALARTSGTPVTLNFWWRPLLDHGGALVGSSMLQARVLAGGEIVVSVYSNATIGLYDFKVSLLGFYVPLTEFTFTGIPMTLRAWNEIEINYDGANTLNLLVNGATVGTIGPTTFLMPAGATGELRFNKEFITNGALMGVLDTVSLTIS